MKLVDDFLGYPIDVGFRWLRPLPHLLSEEPRPLERHEIVQLLGIEAQVVVFNTPGQPIDDCLFVLGSLCGKINRLVTGFRHGDETGGRAQPKRAGELCAESIRIP